MDNFIIAIDGPAGAGKSTIAKILAHNLKVNYIDTGAMYRAITYKCLKMNIDITDPEQVISITVNSKIDFKENNIYLDDNLLGEEIRTMDVSNNVSNIAKIKDVRIHLVKMQRDIGERGSCILDGRDIGSHVFPNAKYKFFLIATPEERGLRRFKELKEKGYDVNLNEIIQNIKERDFIDSSRDFAPLIKASDSIEVDTTNKTIEDVVTHISNFL